MYVKKKHNRKTYCTGTRVYQINKLYQHIPWRLPNTFGRTIVCMYDLEPEQQEYNQNRRQYRQNNRKQTYQTSANTTSDTDSDENTENQWQQQRHYRKKQNQQKRRQNNYNNVTQRRNKYNHQIDQPPPSPRKSTLKITPNYHNNKTKIKTQQHQQSPHPQKKSRLYRKPTQYL